MQISTTTVGAVLKDTRWAAALHLPPQDARPSAWPLVPLGRIVAPRQDKLAPARWPHHRFSYLGLEHIEPHTGALLAHEDRLGAEIRSTCRVFLPGDVLYGRLRPTLNKAYATTAGPVHTGVCSRELLVLTPDPTLALPLFVRALLTSGWVHDHVARLQLGSALPRLQVADLLALRVPLPPLEHQRATEAALLAQHRRRAALLAELHHGPEQDRRAFEHMLAQGRPGPTPSPTPEAAPANLLPNDMPARPGTKNRMNTDG